MLIHYTRYDNKFHRYIRLALLIVFIEVKFMDVPDSDLAKYWIFSQNAVCNAASTRYSAKVLARVLPVTY